MNLLEKILGQCLENDLTETSFWTDGVYRALEQDKDLPIDLDDAAPEVTTVMPGELT